MRQLPSYLQTAQIDATMSSSEKKTSETRKSQSASNGSIGKSDQWGLNDTDQRESTDAADSSNLSPDQDCAVLCCDPLRSLSWFHDIDSFSQAISKMPFICGDTEAPSDEECSLSSMQHGVMVEDEGPPRPKSNTACCKKGVLDAKQKRELFARSRRKRELSSSPHDIQNLERGFTSISFYPTKRRRTVADMNIQSTVQPTDNDVLFGRGEGVNRHPGNIRYREAVAEYKEIYGDIEKKSDKTEYIAKFLELIHKTGARFLDRDKKTKLWFVVEEGKARRKCGQALREKEKKPPASRK